MSNTDFEEPAGEETFEVGLHAEDGEEGSDQTNAEDTGDEQALATEEGGQEEVAQPRRRNSANDTIRELRSRAQQTETRAAALEREIMEIKAAQQARQSQVDPEREAERLAMMTPEERSEYKLNKTVAELRREQALTNFRNEDRSDKALYDAKATADKVYAKYADRVEEQRLKYMREQGTVIPREELLKWIVGQEVLANRGKKAAQQTRQGQRNIQRNTAPLANGRGNQQANRRGAADSPAKRLEGVLI